MLVIFGQVMSVSTGYFDSKGLLYAFRFLAYSLFFVIWAQGRVAVDLRHFIIVGLSVSLFGWIQYLFFPDLTGLKYTGWDDHYFRLVSSFLDPAFAGIILVLAVLVCVYVYQKKRESLYIFISFILLLSLVFTYSRASYAALLLGLFMLLRNAKRLYLLLASVLAVFVIMLPHPEGEGVNLARTNSLVQKVENYRQSVEIIAKAPLFGVGYDNVCRAKALAGFDLSRQRNSCYGLDNSFLLIWATLGVLGLFVLVRFFMASYSPSGRLFQASLLTVFFHSLFTNTLFYPWVLAWLAMLQRVRKSK